VTSVALTVPRAYGYTVTVGGPALQKAVEAAFPITRENAVGAVTLSNPRVLLRPGSRRIGLATNVKAAMPDQPPLTGNGVIDGEIAYDPTRHEFHLREPRVSSLAIDGMEGPFAALVESAVEVLMQDQLPVIVLYRLDEETLRQAPQLRMLKGVGVRNGALVLDLDF
ncbi:MAG: DUF1439 domain-containing protein, partial [Nitrospirota bacterium]|jgi:hypothetical protein